MKAKYIAAGGIAALALGFSVVYAHAHPGGGFGPGMMQGMHGMGPGSHGGFAGPAAAQQLMTPEERAALMDKMRNARTPEERQQIAEATHTEMQKRAKEKGITLPEHRGPRFGATPQAPAATDHTR